MFETSPETDKIYAALAKAQAELKTAKIDSTNPHFRSQYAGLKSVMDSILPALNKHGICVIQPPSFDGENVTVMTRLGHGNQWISSSMSCPVGNRKTAQAIGSVITYLRRYSIQSMTGSTAGVVDDDGNEGSYREAVEQQTQKSESHLQKQRTKLERFKEKKQSAAEISNLPQFEETLERHGWSLAWIEKQTEAQGWGSPRDWKNDTRSRFIQKEAWTQFSLPESEINA
jgi:hypothetical protein